jgi:hypothetical protein
MWKLKTFQYIIIIALNVYLQWISWYNFNIFTLVLFIKNAEFSFYIQMVVVKYRNFKNKVSKFNKNLISVILIKF